MDAKLRTDKDFSVSYIRTTSPDPAFLCTCRCIVRHGVAGSADLEVVGAKRMRRGVAARFSIEQIRRTGEPGGWHPAIEASHRSESLVA